MLELQIKKLVSEGFDQIIINVHHFGDVVKDYLKQNNFFNCSIEISDESEKLLDTGGGLKKASHFFRDGEPFLVYNVDILSNISLRKLINIPFGFGKYCDISNSKQRFFTKIFV